jgi:hypothetical protein
MVFLPAGRPAVVDAFAVKPLAVEGPEARFPAVVRAHAACLGDGPAVAKPEALRELLVALIEEADPGLAWSGATDLVRHEALHEGLTADQRRRVLASFRRRPAGKMDKPAVALALAAARPPGAAAALVEALGIPGARAIRTNLGESLRRLGDVATPSLLEAAYRGAPAATKADLLRAAGLAGQPASLPLAKSALGEGSAEIRAEGAQALGLLAREIRRADPAAALPGPEDLERAAVRGEGFGDDHRAALWALAQVEAWPSLRRIAAEDPRPEARAFAERCLRTPRRSLVLAGGE